MKKSVIRKKRYFIIAFILLGSFLAGIVIWKAQFIQRFFSNYFIDFKNHSVWIVDKDAIYFFERNGITECKEYGNYIKLQLTKDNFSERVSKRQEYKDKYLGFKESINLQISSISARLSKLSQESSILERNILESSLELSKFQIESIDKTLLDLDTQTLDLVTELPKLDSLMYKTLENSCHYLIQFPK